MKTETYLATSSVIFALVALGQFVRLVQGWAVQIGPYSVPMAASWAAVALAAFMAIWGFSRLRLPR